MAQGSFSYVIDYLTVTNDNLVSLSMSINSTDAKKIDANIDSLIKSNPDEAEKILFPNFQTILSTLK